MKARYPGYDVLDKWHSPSFDAPTRAVLSERLGRVPARRYLDAGEWALAEALAARLVPQPERAVPIPVAPWIDDLLLHERGEGFRYEGMPHLRQAWHAGLAAIDAEARRLRGSGFAVLDAAAQDAVLAAVAAGEVDPAHWGGMPARRFFYEVLLKTVAGIYYAHPDAWSEIGFGGPASPRGYVRLGAGMRDGWEAQEGS